MRAQTQCDQCGRIDDHPKAHGPGVVPILSPDGQPELDDQGQQRQRVATKHHDCLSAWEERVLTDAAQPAGSGPKASAVIAACKEGARGPELLAKIESGELTQAEGLAERAQLEQEGADRG